VSRSRLSHFVLVPVLISASALDPSVGAATRSDEAPKDEAALPPPLALEASIEAIQLRPGFRIELVAAEPLVRDPVAFDWDTRGRLWVVEMADYPLGIDGQGTPGGRLKLLEDADGDGRYDRATLLIDDLAYPNGVMAWKDGALVSAAPEILYVEDTDNDGRLDVQQPLFTGFAEANPQHRVNGFALGLDGWVRAADADGGQIRSEIDGSTVEIRGRDIRFDPETGALEPAGGRSQFGRSRDDWGNWFGNTNSVWAWHDVLSDRDLRRNPSAAPSGTTQLLEPDTSLYPASETLARFNDPFAANRVTSACGPALYRDELLDIPPSLFICEPVHNLVHRMILEPEGASVRGRRAKGEENAEFFASTDHWFRPVMVKTGPDGALWIADMHRAVIEHPEWIPDDWERRIDLRAGEDRGRIYRVVPDDAEARPIPWLDGLATPDLVTALDSPNGWQRDTAQRLLMHREDPAVIPELRRLATRAERPETIVQTIWTLAILDGLDEATIRFGVDHDHAEVRRHAILASRLFLTARPEIGALVLQAAADDSPRVRFAAALALGDWEAPEAGRALASIAARDASDRWIRAAALSSARPHAETILTELLERSEPVPEALLDPLLATAASTAGSEGLADLARSILDAVGGGEAIGPASISVLAALLDEADRAGVGLDVDFEGLVPAFEAGRQIAVDSDRSEADRASAVRLLGRQPDRRRDDLKRLTTLLDPTVPDRVQRTAVASLVRLGDDRVPEALLSGWNAHGPSIRAAILNALLSRRAWVEDLLGAIETGRVQAAEISAADRSKLRSHPDAAIRSRAETVFGAVASQRADVLERYRSALETAGDPERGRAVFLESCASCHRLEDEGHAVGPDLLALTDRSPEALLVAILDPNRAFESKYAAYNIATTDGRVHSGLIAAETSNGVTLLGEEGERTVLLRSEIEQMASSGQSLMPEGLEEEIDPAAMADLIAFLRELVPPPKPVPGNHPELVEPEPDGTILLTAEVAEIRGNRLTFETLHQNLGWWIADNDWAAWTFLNDRPGRYAVELEWACHDDAAGGHYRVEVGAERIEGTVPATGSWNDYERAAIGEVTLAPGRHRLEMRPNGATNGPLIDLRSITLRPLEDSSR